MGRKSIVVESVIKLQTLPESSRKEKEGIPRELSRNFGYSVHAMKMKLRPAD